jgi:hypothetical protein
MSMLGMSVAVLREIVVVFVDAFHNSIILSVSGSSKDYRR